MIKRVRKVNGSNVKQQKKAAIKSFSFSKTNSESELRGVTSLNQSDDEQMNQILSQIESNPISNVTQVCRREMVIKVNEDIDIEMRKSPMEL